MPRKETWIEIPLVINEGEFMLIAQHFSRFGIRFKDKVKVVEVAGKFETHKFRTIRVPEEQVKAAALVYRNALEIDDPATFEPLTGECPACGEQVDGAWECPSCEINYRGQYTEDSPIVLFIREHGGYDDP